MSFHDIRALGSVDLSNGWFVKVDDANPNQLVLDNSAKRVKLNSGQEEFQMPDSETEKVIRLLNNLRLMVYWKAP